MHWRIFKNLPSKYTRLTDPFLSSAYSVHRRRITCICECCLLLALLLWLPDNLPTQILFPFSLPFSFLSVTFSFCSVHLLFLCIFVLQFNRQSFSQFTPHPHGRPFLVIQKWKGNKLPSETLKPPPTVFLVLLYRPLQLKLYNLYVAILISSK